MKIAFAERMGTKDVNELPIYRAVIVTDTPVDDEFFLDGFQVDGIEDAASFAAGSIVLDTSSGSSYVCGEVEGSFHKWG